LRQSEDLVFVNLKKILSGEMTIRLYLDFLYKNNKADLLVLQNTKDALEARASMYHSAVTFSNAFMNAGTTSDTFLRSNLDWLGRASNWSKFSATAALGVIHKGNLARGMTILGPYLPGAAGGAPASPYSEGGSLFALGLIHAGRGREVLDFLKEKLSGANGEEVVQHGAALGLGVAGMASGNEGELLSPFPFNPALHRTNADHFAPIPFLRRLRPSPRDALHGLSHRRRGFRLRDGPRHARHSLAQGVRGDDPVRTRDPA
jgi:hypothetical protein